MRSTRKRHALHSRRRQSRLLRATSRSAPPGTNAGDLRAQRTLLRRIARRRAVSGIPRADVALPHRPRSNAHAAVDLAFVSIGSRHRYTARCRAYACCTHDDTECSKRPCRSVATAVAGCGRECAGRARNVASASWLPYGIGKRWMAGNRCVARDDGRRWAQTSRVARERSAISSR